MSNLDVFVKKERKEREAEREVKRAAAREARKLPEPYQSYRAIIGVVALWGCIWMLGVWMLAMASIYLIIAWGLL